VLGAGVIVFREVLEAALVVTILLAATRGLLGRNRWIGSGVAAGVLGAVIVAYFAGNIAEAFAGIGQELFNAGVLFIAVLMLAWHNIWMSGHAREMVANLKAGNVDGYLAPDPFNQRAVYENVGFIYKLSKDIWDRHPCCAFTCTQ